MNQRSHPKGDGKSFNNNAILHHCWNWNLVCIGDVSDLSNAKIFLMILKDDSTNALKKKMMDPALKM